MRSFQSVCLTAAIAAALTACSPSEPAVPSGPAAPATPPSASAPATPSNGIATQANDRVFEPGVRFGAVTATTTLDELRSTFGADQVSDIKIYLGEGEEASGTAVFKGTDDEFHILWKDANHSGVQSIYVIGHQWKSPESIGIGTTLKQLNELNGKGITFFGFGWDYGGTVNSFNGGALSKYKRQQMVLRLDLPDNEPDNALMGDKEYSSTSAAAQAIPGIAVDRIILGFK